MAKFPKLPANGKRKFKDKFIILTLFPENFSQYLTFRQQN